MPVFPFSSNTCGRSSKKSDRPPQQTAQNPGWNNAAGQSNYNIQPPYGMNLASPTPPQTLSPPPRNPGWTASPAPYVASPPPPQFNYPLQNVKWASTSNVHNLSPQQSASWQSSVSLPASLPNGLCGAAISVTSLGNVASGNEENGHGYVQQGQGLFNAISSKFDDVISLIDEEVFSGQDSDLSKQSGIIPRDSQSATLIAS